MGIGWHKKSMCGIAEVSLLELMFILHILHLPPHPLIISYETFPLEPSNTFPLTLDRDKNPLISAYMNQFGVVLSLHALTVLFEGKWIHFVDFPLLFN